MGEISVWDLDRTEQDLADTMTALGVLREALNEVIARLKAEVEVTPKEVKDPLGDISKVLLSAVDLERKAREQRAKSNGGLGGGALDLDAARDEIECRLACLRAAGGGGEVP